MNHTIDRVPRRFNEGPFWGNASMGALLYTDDDGLRFAVDQVRLWEMRDHRAGRMPVTFEQAKVMKQPEFARQFPGGSFAWKGGPCPTRLPGLTFRLLTDSPVTEFQSDTDLLEAISVVTWRSGGPTLEARIWVDANTDVLVVEMNDAASESTRVQPEGWDLGLAGLKPLAAWDYPSAERREYADGEHLVQPFSGDQVAILSYLRSGTLLLCTLSTGHQEKVDEIAVENEERLRSTGRNLSEHRERHLASWNDFWTAFQIRLPDQTLQRAVEIELYKLYCNARSSGWPMTLQGIWNHDQAIPAWFGDWHNDLNVQACYWPAFKTNHVELARPYMQYFSDATPHFRKRAEQFAGVPDGICVPTSMAPDGKGAGTDWTFWNSLLGPELYTAIDFCWYYEHTQDKGMLEETIVPYLAGVVRFYEAVVERREDGRLHIPFAHSPEVMEETGLALHDDTTFMVSSLRYVLERLAGYLELLAATDADGPEQSAEADRLREMASDLMEPATGERGLQLWPGTDLWYSHRHFCHLFPIFPLGQISRSVPEQAWIIGASLDLLSDLGAAEYAAFSFPYRAILSARAGRGDAARLHLYNYIMGLTAPNTFCVNGDAYKTGVIMSSEESAGQPSDVFTLEAGLIVPAAVCEMLAHRAGNTVWLLPAIPSDWKEGMVKGLTIEGGHRIDLEFSDYALERAVLNPGSDEELTVVIGASAGRYRVRNGSESNDVEGDESFTIRTGGETGAVEIQLL